MNRQLVSACVLLISVSAFANKGAEYQAHHPTHPKIKSGVYLGAGIGAAWAGSDWQGSSSMTAVNDNNSMQAVLLNLDTQGSQGAETEFIGRVAFGYQLVMEKLFLATEVGGDFAGKYSFDFETTQAVGPLNSAGQLVSATAILSDQVTLDGSEVTVDFRPGYLLADNLLIYARMGLAFNTLKIESSGIWIEESNDTDPRNEVSGSSDATKGVVAMRMGLGIEYLFRNQWGVYADYVYTNYGTIETTTAVSGDFSDYQHITAVDSPVVTVNNQTGMLGIIYHWK